MKKLILGFLLIISCVILSNAQPMLWAKQMGGTNSDECNSLAVDDSGNVYTTGFYTGTVDFDPGPGTFNLTSVAGNDDIFISKLDASGNFVWAKSLGGASSDIGYSIAIDGSGNVYTTGRFWETADFDPGSGIFNLTSTSTGYDDIFISKLDASGNFVWAKRIGGTKADVAFSLAVDDSGNVYTTGVFLGTADFDPNSGTFYLTPAGLEDVFISKLDASGNFVWAKQLGGTNNDWVKSMTLDGNGNVYTTGYFAGTSDFDPGAGTFNLTSAGGHDIFISKLDASGNFVWAKQLGGTDYDWGISVAVDGNGNVYNTGRFKSTADFDPGSGIFNLTSLGFDDVFISKLDASGNFLWAKQLGGTNYDWVKFMTVDGNGNVYTTGSFKGTLDSDPGSGMFNLTSTSVGYNDIFISKLDASGNFVWAKQMGGTSDDYGNSIALDGNGFLYFTGYFYITADFDTINLISAGSSDIFVAKLVQSGIIGWVYNDINQNCIKENEAGIHNRKLIINPGNIIAETNYYGFWHIDSLPSGNYTIIADTSGNWKRTCPLTQSFTIINPDSLYIAPSFGFVSTQPCAEPQVSVNMPRMRPGFSSQPIYVQACNEYKATGALYNWYIELELDPLIIPQSSSVSYTSLGGNKYKFVLPNDTLNPGQCETIIMNCSLSTSAVLNSTLCIKANLYPADSCVFDTIPNIPTGVTPCTLPWDKSSLKVTGKCTGDSIRFVVYNHGSGSMQCYAPVRIYVNGVLTTLDSIMLTSGDSAVYTFLGDGKTWRLEADQHPLHPGNSHPNATIENCNPGNWTPRLVNVLPQDDADGVVDIYCGVVTGSYDPNDKTGYPLGINSTHDIMPNKQLEYVIRFQNTGTDTAFTVVIRDTLDTDLDIFSVVSGVSSHKYKFRMYGKRVLEWTFNNILLPDSNVNEAKSHGFITFTVEQNRNLPNGTELTNTAGIYFDFNAPIITNTTVHTVNESVQSVVSSIKPVSLSLSKTKGLIVYPNPATNELTISVDASIPQHDSKVEIYNVIGVKMLEARSKKLDSSIPQSDSIVVVDISDLPKGMYVVKSGTEVVKLVVE